MSEDNKPCPDPTDRDIFLEGKLLRKVYDPVVAVNNVSIRIAKGDVLALVGANGAGKSTLTKILSGETISDQGELIIDDQSVDLTKYSPGEARERGIRVVHQELSLCKNLTVYENFYIEQYQRINRPFGWRPLARRMAVEALDRVFPDHNIDVTANLATLSIAQQQMVEIARATSDPDLKLLILDEPTSALPTKQTEQLQQYIKETTECGVSYIYISHRLKEIMYLANRIYIMRNGTEIWQCVTADTSEEDMIRRMGEGIGSGEEELAILECGPEAINEKVSVNFNDYSAKGLKNVTCAMTGGQVVGITGLEGNGQLKFLQEIFNQGGKNKNGAKVTGKVAYIAGDRKKEGIFPLWSIADNMTISKIAGGSLFKCLTNGPLNKLIGHWYDHLRVKSAGPGALITSLSGGNQQKVLIARAMAVDADIILLNDPTRGVDVATKTQLYQVFREAASCGKLVVWRTSDDAELEICTHLLVMNAGAVAAEFNTGQVSHEDILKVAFTNKDHKKQTVANKKNFTAPLWLFSLIAVVLLYGTCGYMSPRVFSKFGFELLAVGFAPFVFAALAQTFIVGLGHIDLSVGAFMGLVNVLCATVLNDNTGLGLLALGGALLAYSLMGLVIYLRNLPSIIVTLGMSFVWTGFAFFLQDMPGGHTPDWMVTLFNFDNPILQGVLLYLIAFIILGIGIYTSRYGTVLRGFGNNDQAVINSGWSKAKAYLCIYMISGIFAMMGGISFSAITGASDVNASTTFTMLTVAAVIIGGGYFTGGVVTHVGAVFGAVALTMVSVILGLFDISTDYTATIQGLVLLIILSLRIFKKQGGQVNV